MKDPQWNMKPDQPKALMLAKRQLADQDIALNQAKAWRTLFSIIEKNAFEISAESACLLHAIAANG